MTIIKILSFLDLFLRNMVELHKINRDEEKLDLIEIQLFPFLHL